MVILRPDDIHFPKPTPGNGYGEIAVGGDLSPERLIEASRGLTFVEGILPGIVPTSALSFSRQKYTYPIQRGTCLIKGYIESLSMRISVA